MKLSLVWKPTLVQMICEIYCLMNRLRGTGYGVWKTNAEDNTWLKSSPQVTQLHMNTSSRISAVTYVPSHVNDMTKLMDMFPQASSEMKTFIQSQRDALTRKRRTWNRDVLSSCISMYTRNQGAERFRAIRVTIWKTPAEIQKLRPTRAWRFTGYAPLDVQFSASK